MSDAPRRRFKPGDRMSDRIEAIFDTLLAAYEAHDRDEDATIAAVLGGLIEREPLLVVLLDGSPATWRSINAAAVEALRSAIRVSDARASMPPFALVDVLLTAAERSRAVKGFQRVRPATRTVQ